MTAPAYAHVQRQESLEDARDSYRAVDTAEYRRHHDTKRLLARQLYPLYLRWIAETGHASRMQFMAWLSDEVNPPRRLYDQLSAGRALSSGLDFDLGVSDLAVLGRLLDKLTPAEVQARIEVPGGLEALKAEATTQRKEGQVSVPTSELASVQAAIKRVSDSDNLPAPEALALTVQAFDALPDTLRSAAIESHRTGMPLEDAARRVVTQMLDPRMWLSQRPCFVPGCGMPSAELHHLKLVNTRFRSQEVLAPLCHRHHQAQTGQQSAHANHQQDWIAQHWPSQEAFWLDLAALYAERLFGKENA